MLERPEQLVSDRLRRWLIGVLVGYAALLALILRWAGGGAGSRGGGLVRQGLLGQGCAVGCGHRIRLESLLNALMVVSLPLLVSLLWPRWSWQQWTAYGFLGSLCVEGVQAVFLAGRGAQFVDVVANTSGGRTTAVCVTINTTTLIGEELHPSLGRRPCRSACCHA